MADNIEIDINVPAPINVDIEYFYPQGPAGKSSWGDISGNLIDQTDLWSVLSAKALNTDLLSVSSSVLNTNTFLSNSSGSWNGGNNAYTWVTNNSANAIFQTVSAISLSGIFYGDGSNLIGASLPGQAGINTTVQTNSASWNTAYNIATAYQSASGSFATNTALNAASGLLTPLTVTNTLTSQLVLTTDFNDYKTDVASATATLLPTSVYQNASGSFVPNTVINELTGNWNTAYSIATAYESVSSTFVQTVCGTANQINIARNGSTVTASLPSSAIFPGDVSIIGNLTLAGSATYINATNLVVGDNIIYFNNNNYGSNVLDVGIVSHFTQAPLGYNHTGLIRRAGQGTPGIWTLFSGLTTEPLSAANIDWNDKNIVVDSLSANLIGNVTGNADTVTNGVYTNQSYTDPSWINSLADTKITGTNRNNWDSTYTTVNSNSGNWNSAYSISTAYQNASSTFATNTTLNAISSQLLPTSVYQNASGSFATNTLLQSTSALLTPLTVTNTLTSQLLPTSVYQNASGSFATNTALNSVSSLLTPLTLTNTLTSQLLPTSVYQNASGSFATNTALNAASGLLTPLTVTNTLTSQLLPTSVYQNASGSFATNTFVTRNFLPLSGGIVTNNLSISSTALLSATTITTSSLSTNFVYGSATESVFTDGSSLIGNGASTLTLNYPSGVYVNSNMYLNSTSFPSRLFLYDPSGARWQLTITNTGSVSTVKL